jgi:hypothetical protein
MKNTPISHIYHFFLVAFDVSSASAENRIIKTAKPGGGQVFWARIR